MMFYKQSGHSQVFIRYIDIRASHLDNKRAENILGEYNHDL